MPRSLRSLLLLLSLGLIWGTGYSLARFVVTHGVSAIGYSFWLSLGPALMLSVLGLRFRKKPASPWPAIPKLGFYLITGLTGIGIPNTCMYFAAGHLPSGLLAVIVNTVPLVIWPLSLLTGLERFSLKRLSGLLLAMTGLFMLLASGTGLPAQDNLPWALLALVTPLSYASCTLIIARFRPTDTHPVKLAAGMLLASSILLAPVVAFSKSFYLPHPPFHLVDALILLEIFLSGAGYLLFFELIRLAGPVYYSLVDTTVALTGLGWGTLLFQESISPWMGSSIFMILSGLALITFFQHQKDAGY